MSAPAPRVLFFSPYAAWRYHTALEATWGHALRLRGADVRFVTCDGLSGACDVYRPDINPRDALSCAECQARCASQLSELATPFTWLGSYVPHAVRERAALWARALPREALLDARWNELPVGEWARASACTHFRSAELELLHPRVDAAVRAFLAGTVLFAEGIDVLLDELRPDVLVLLNGRFFAHWAAIELARRRGLRFVTHERGFRRDTVRFAAGARTHELEPMRASWEAWKDVPLDEAELEEIGSVLADRRAGRNASRLSFSPPPQDPDALRSFLHLDGRPLVAAFGSSDDETAAFEDRRRGAFPRSRDFFPAVAELARARPDVQFVLRVHPNVHKQESGLNRAALRQAVELRGALPRNARMVLPREEVSSYTLMDLADVGLVQGSTVGLEMAALGKPVLCAAHTTYSHAGCTTPLERPEDLPDALDAALRPGARDAGRARETARRALRWGLRYFRAFSIPFDLVREEPDHGARIAYSDLRSLERGAHATLDRIADFLLGRTADVLPPPSDAERARGTAAEDLYLARWLAAADERAAGSRAA